MLEGVVGGAGAVLVKPWGRARASLGGSWECLGGPWGFLGGPWWLLGRLGGRPRAPYVTHTYVSAFYIVLC